MPLTTKAHRKSRATNPSAAIPVSRPRGSEAAAKAIVASKAGNKEKKKRERRDVGTLLQQSNLIKHEQLIDPRHLELLEGYITSEFPKARFNKEGSSYYSLASSYRNDADTGLRLACLIISNGDKFYLDVATADSPKPEFYESPSNSIE